MCSRAARVSLPALQTVVLLLYAQWVMVTIVLLPWYGFTLHIPAYTAVTLVALISHCRAQFTDPGAVPLDRLVWDEPIDLQPEQRVASRAGTHSATCIHVASLLSISRLLHLRSC